MTTSPRRTYARSSDIRSRTHLEYRRDMKKKGIAELEFLQYLQRLLREMHGDDSLTVRKSGGDAELWFARDGSNISGAPDYKATLSTGQSDLYEFQIAYKSDGLTHFDFKVSKVVKRGTEQPLTNRRFFYVIKDQGLYAFFPPKWVTAKGGRGFAPAWRSPAYRVKKGALLSVCLKGDDDLRSVIQSVDDKNCLLEFQHEFLSLESRKLAKRLQQVVDAGTPFQIASCTLDGFYQACYLLDKLEKEPDAPGVWLVDLLKFFRDDMRTIDFAHFMYALDFLYFKCVDIKQNEGLVLTQAIENAAAYINDRANGDGSLGTDAREAPIEETRRLLFAANLLEDIRQDAAVSFEMNLPKVEKIFETIPDVSLTANYIRSVLQE